MSLRNNQNYKPCRHCGSEIKKSAMVCPYCHESQYNNFYKVILIVIVVILVLIVGYVFMRTNY